MAYVPNNLEAYTAAFAGAVAGMAASGWMTQQTQASYARVNQIAGAFAQAFDTAWNSTSPLNALEQAAITDMVASDFQGRGPSDATVLLQQSNWTLPASACVAAVLQSDAYFAANGIVPPVSPISPISPSPYASVTDWWVSPATGNDSNAGTTSGAPLKTKAEIARRLGSWNPNINGINVTVHQLDPDLNGNDPWLFVPTLLNGASMILTSPLPTPSFTGTLLAVTAKNRGTGTPLKSTFTVLTGAVVAGMMLVNTTRGNSRAFAFRNTGGGNWIITQPCAPQAVPLAAAGIPTEVDTWANGDAILGYALTNVCVGEWGAYAPQNNAATTAGCYLYQVNAQDYNEAAGDGVTAVGGNLGYFAIEASFVTAPVGGTFNISGFPLPQWSNCFFGNGFTVISAMVSAGGNITFPAYGVLTNVNSDYCVSSFMWLRDNSQVGGGLYVDGSTQVFFSNNCIFGTLGVAYGANTAILNFGPGTHQYPTGAGKAAAAFVGVTIQLYTKTTAYSALTAGGVGSGGVTTYHNLNFTAANLDAAAGAAGFGGTAYGNGAVLTNTTQN